MLNSADFRRDSSPWTAGPAAQRWNVVALTIGLRPSTAKLLASDDQGGGLFTAGQAATKNGAKKSTALARVPASENGRARTGGVATNRNRRV